jgi:putative phosphotransacetylase
LILLGILCIIVLQYFKKFRRTLKMKLPIALSNRHVHLSQADIDVLFGAGHQLVELKPLSQPGQYACEEKVDLVGPKGTIKGVRVLGPSRPSTQVEISLSDGFALGVKAPIKESGDIAGTPGVKLVGPAGEVELTEGVIVASRHIHMSLDDAAKFGVQDKQIVKVKTFGPRSVVFENVLVRANANFALEMHVDVEEGNAAAVKNGEMVELIAE